MKKYKIKKVTPSKNGDGDITYKLNIPIKWARKLGLTLIDREVMLEFKEETKTKKTRIVITKFDDDLEYYDLDLI